MSRTVSLAMLVALFNQQTDDAIIPLLTIEHPGMEDTLRFALNGENIISRTFNFLAFPFDLTVPDDSPDRPPQANLSVSNIDRQMTAFLESSVIPPTVAIEIIKASAPDVVEAAWSGLTLRNVKYNVQAISGALTYEKMATEGYPRGVFSPSYFAGMF